MNLKKICLLITLILFYRPIQAALSLLQAVANNDIPRAQQLLASGANINAQTNEQETVLHLTRSPEMTMFLLNHGAHPLLDHTTRRGDTPLDMALLREREDIIITLLQAGAPVTRKQLKFAAYQNRFVKEILDHCNKDVPYPTAAIMAKSAIPTLRLFVEHGFSVNTPGKFYSPLGKAFMRVRRHPFIRELVNQGADMHKKQDADNTPLHLACLLSDAESVRLFLDNGADSMAQDINGTSPLHAAQLVFYLSHLEEIRTGQKTENIVSLEKEPRFDSVKLLLADAFKKNKLEKLLTLKDTDLNTPVTLPGEGDLFKRSQQFMKNCLEGKKEALGVLKDSLTTTRFKNSNPLVFLKQRELTGKPTNHILFKQKK